MLFLTGAGYADYEKVKLAWRHPPNAADTFGFGQKE